MTETVDYITLYGKKIPITAKSLFNAYDTISYLEGQVSELIKKVFQLEAELKKGKEYTIV